MRISISQLVSVIQQVAPFTFPKMNEGTNYLYKNFYNRLTAGERVMLSGLDFDAFDADDIRSLNILHNEVLENNCIRASGITDTLKGINPVSKVMPYV